MQEYIKTLISGLQTWVKGLVKRSTADWNQNDPDADNYVKNRTHWEEEKMITEVIQDGLSVDFTNCGVQDWEASSIENYIYEYNGSNILEAGKTYNVIYDGQEHTLKAFIDNEWGNVVLGNGALVSSANDDNGLPFAIGCYGVGENIGYILSITQETHSFYVSLTEAKTVIHKIDKKWLALPSNLATTDDVQEAVDVANNAQTTAVTAQNAMPNVLYATVSSNTLTVTTSVNLQDGHLYIIIPDTTPEVNIGAYIKIGATKYSVYAGISDTYGMTGSAYSNVHASCKGSFSANLPTMCLYSANKKAFYVMSKSQNGYLHAQQGENDGAPDYIYGKSSNGYAYRYKPMRVKSSTEGSSKLFDITMDDNGTITAVEVTE